MPVPSRNQTLVSSPSTRSVPLSEGTYIIGRSRDADLFVSDPSASRRHARLVVGAGETRIEDLRSKNGTLINGTRLKGKLTLRLGDKITIGNQSFTLSPEERGSKSNGRLLIEGCEWTAPQDQTERTLDLLDILLSERSRNTEQARSMAHLIITSVDELLDVANAPLPALTRKQVYRIGQLISAAGLQTPCAEVYAWQATARRRLDKVTQQQRGSAA